MLSHKQPIFWNYSNLMVTFGMEGLLILPVHWSIPLGDGSMTWPRNCEHWCRYKNTDSQIISTLSVFLYITFLSALICVAQNLLWLKKMRPSSLVSVGNIYQNSPHDLPELSMDVGPILKLRLATVTSGSYRVASCQTKRCKLWTLLVDFLWPAKVTPQNQLEYTAQTWGGWRLLELSQLSHGSIWPRPQPTTSPLMVSRG